MKINGQKFISIALIILLIFSSTITAFADDAGTDGEGQGKQEEQLKAEKEAEKKAAEEKAKQEAEKKAAEEKAAAEKAQKEAEEKAAREKAKQEAEDKADAEKPADNTGSQEAGDQSQPDEPSESQPEAITDGEPSQSAEEDGSGKALTESDEEEPGDNAKGSKLKMQGGLSDGTYKPKATFEGGSGRVSFTCKRVIIIDGEATAVIDVNTTNVTHLYMGTLSSREENRDLYDPDTGECGENVYAFQNKRVAVPVTLGEKVGFSGRTIAMSEANRWIGYKYQLIITDESQKISDDTTIPEGDIPDDPPEDPEEEKDDDKPKKTLKDGTYKVKATTCRVMFFLYPKDKNPATAILVKKNGKMTATITLSGTGYDYVYMGTPKQAKKAGKKKWIKYKKVNGYYTFTIPVSKLDKKLKITPHSSKYESDGDPSTEPWRPDKWIKFYSSGAKKVKSGTAIKTKKRKDDASSRRNSNSSGKTQWADDSKAGTTAVNNSTGLKDGTYKPDKFSWSGGSGRLAYIRCTKITVKGGKAYATIEFGSSKYDSLRAGGRTFSKSGGGNSKFTIPVKLNANNIIVGRTTAMSQPHWVKYRIYIYKKGAAAGKGNNDDAAEGDDGHVTSTRKLSEKAPDLLGLEFKEVLEIKYAKYFRIFKYEQDIILISVDQAADTALYKEEEKEDKKSSDKQETDDSQGVIEYDEDGKPIAKSQNEITDELYKNNVVNYLIVPEKAEIPAGLEKDCVIIQQPVKASYIASDPILTDIIRLGHLDCVAGISMDIAEVKDKKLKQAIENGDVKALGDSEKPDYASIVKLRADFAVLPDDVLPAKVTKKSTDEEVKESEETSVKLGTMQSRFAALGVPLIVDRSGDEKTNYATAEWIKVYGAVYGEEQKAEELFEEYIKKNDKEKNA